MTIKEEFLTSPMIVTCADCGHLFDWAENPGPCPECGGTRGTYKNRPVGLKTGH